jgi:ABC-2 type transport system ATP-binding protein
MPLDGWNEPAIVARSLTRDFGKIRAVDSVSFAVDRGEVFALLGPNGSGKTTIIRMLCGAVTPSSGEAFVLSYDVVTQADRIKARIGYMSQKFGLYPDLTVAENLDFYAGAYGMTWGERTCRIAEMLEQAGLAQVARQRTSTLSGGWKQRLAIACATIHRPPLLFLDEPTAGVDPVSRRQFWSIIHSLARDGITIFLTTHYIDEAEGADRVALMYRGQIEALDTPANLRATGLKGRLVEILCRQPLVAMRLLEKAQFVRDVVLFGTRIHAIVRDELSTGQIGDLMRDEGLAVDEVRAITPSLEDVFISRLRK